MYKQMLKAALAAVAIVGIGGTAQAAPSGRGSMASTPVAVSAISADDLQTSGLTLNGNTGMFLNPNAYLVRGDQPRAQVNYFGIADGVKTYNLTGVMRAGDRAEVGAGISKLKSDYYYDDTTDFIINGKYQLRAPVDGSFALAVGAGYNGALADNKYAYLVASKPFGKIIDRGPISASLGVRWDRFWDSSKVSIFGGVEVPVGDKLSIIGELQSKNLEYYGTTPYSLGVRYRANDKFTLGAGIARLGLDYDSSGSKLFFQAGYTFGK